MDSDSKRQEDVGGDVQTVKQSNLSMFDLAWFLETTRVSKLRAGGGV